MLPAGQRILACEGRILQAVAFLKALKETWEKLIAEHDAAFNPDQKPHSSKRPVSEVTNLEVVQQALPFPHHADDPKTIVDLSDIVRVPGHGSHFDLIADGNGDFYLLGRRMVSSRWRRSCARGMVHT